MGHHTFFTLLSQDVRSRRKSMDVPGLSCSPGVEICECDKLTHPSPFQQHRKSIESSLPFSCSRLTIQKRKRHVAQGSLAAREASAGLPVVTAKAKCNLCLEARVPYSSFVSLRCTHHGALVWSDWPGGHPSSFEGHFPTPGGGSGEIGGCCS